MDDLQPDEKAPFTDATRARMAQAYAAYQLADSARRFVSIHPGELYTAGGGAADGTRVADMARLVAEAEHLLGRTVVAERLAGASWDQIGEALGITRQSAHRRFAEAEHDFRAALAEPEGVSADGHTYLRLDTAAYEPDTAAARLDNWLVQTWQPGDPDGGEDHPVSRGLARLHPQAELLALSHQRRQLLDTYVAPPPQEMVPIAERELQLWEQLATMPEHATTAREAADSLRQRLTELRAQLATATATDTTEAHS